MIHTYKYYILQLTLVSVSSYIANLKWKQGKLAKARRG